MEGYSVSERKEVLPKVGKGNVCVIYDSDERYAKRLMGIINDSKDIPYKARIFTRKEEFNKYIVDNDTDVLMVNEECYTYEVQKKSDSNVIVLCEEESEAKKINDKKRDGHTGVCKYQPAYQILGAISKKGVSVKDTKTYDGFKCIGVYSFNSSLRVMLALVMSAAFSKKGKTLFINLDEFSGLEQIMSCDGTRNLSDALYMFKQAGMRYTDNISQCICGTDMFDYIPAVVCADDISYAGDKVLGQFIDAVAHKGQYEYIIINISEGIQRPWKFMEKCEVTYVADSGDYIERCRFNNLKRYLIENDLEYVADSIMRINLKTREDIDENFLQRIMYTDAYGYVSELINYL